MNRKQIPSALLALAAIAIAAWFGWQKWQNQPSEAFDAANGNRPSLAMPSLAMPSNRVRLNNEQDASADIKTQIVHPRDLQLHRVLPARFVYDETRHVAVRTPAGGVLQSVRVKIGQSVNPGQTVAILRSPAIGDARNQILDAQSHLELARKLAAWKSQIRNGVRELVEAIRTGQSAENIRQSLSEQRAGEYGGDLLTAYSKSRLANQTATSIGNIGKSGAISGRVIRERQSEQQQTAVNLEAMIEQSLFDTEQALLKADAEVATAERNLRIANQKLATLLGRVDDPRGGNNLSPNDPDVSRFEVQAPIAGTVERKLFSPTERVSAQDELFTIADTTRLWIEADIRGRDWDSIRVQPGDTVKVTVPSMEIVPPSATVNFIGRQVDPQSGAIPLVADVDNSDGRFRPGQFARVSVPTRTLESVIAVPSSALIDLDGQSSVFVHEGQDYVATAVVVGERNDELIEIRQGIQRGQAVVTSGAFLLKSELLLEGEE